jgi:hypothetical protein
MRDILALIAAVDSPLGQAAETINDLAAHLPPPGEPLACPLCPRQRWPCTAFEIAAGRLETAHRLRVGQFLPLDLHPRLWPPPAPAPSAPSPQHQPLGWFSSDMDRR